jgi:hypothetical protein
LLFLQLSSNIFAIALYGDKIRKSIIIKFILISNLKMLKISSDLKFFLIALVAFIISHFIYNNFTTNSIAKNISFRDITVEVVGEIELKLSCNGKNTPNSSSVNRGLGEKTENLCSGTGNFKAKLPQQRFIESPDLGN